MTAKITIFERSEVPPDRIIIRSKQFRYFRDRVFIHVFDFINLKYYLSFQHTNLPLPIYLTSDEFELLTRKLDGTNEIFPLDPKA